MRYTRRYIQFNNLVFDDYDMVGEFDDSSTSFKQTSKEYSYGHGDYAPFKNETMFLRAGTVSITIFLRMRKLPCDKREFYRDLAVEELSKPGKLWAVQNNELVWAYAYVTNINESVLSILNVLELTVDFSIYEGVWHKADPLRTFLQPYDTCTFIDCYDFQHKDNCPPIGNECCDCYDYPTVKTDDSCCCACDEVTKDMALCYHKDELQSLYDHPCGTSAFRVIYDCQKAIELFGDSALGSRICTKDACGSTIAGMLYSNTSIPTTNVTITLRGGNLRNPKIEINGNANVISGTYNGTLTIHSSGDIYYKDDCCETLLDPSVWEIPEGNVYGFTIKPRNNRVLIDLGACCGMTCAFIYVDALTI